MKGQSVSFQLKSLIILPAGWKIPLFHVHINRNLFQNDLPPKYLYLHSAHVCIPSWCFSSYIYLHTTNQSSCRNVGSGFCFYKSLMKWKLLLGTKSMESSIEREGNGIVCEFGNFCMREIFAKIVKFSSIYLIFDWLLINPLRLFESSRLWKDGTCNLGSQNQIFIKNYCPGKLNYFI